MKELEVKTSSPYRLYIGEDIINNILAKECRRFCDKMISKIVIICDYNLKKIYQNNIGRVLQDNLSNSNIEITQVYIKISEKLKNQNTKTQIENKLFELNCGRDTLLITMGGGVLLDIVGFVAATFNRGVPIIYIATTLLAMVDASIGGKTGINNNYGKNLIGAIKQPNAVVIDISSLESLPDGEYLSAISEIIKVAIVFDRNLFNFLSNHKNEILAREPRALTHIIYESVKIKSNIVINDEHESGLRELLNFGHTIGHAVEKLTDYAVSHGNAVALGIYIELYISYFNKILSKEDLQLAIDLIELYFSNKINLETNIDPLSFYNLMLCDKKTKSNQPHCVLIKSIGEYLSQNNKYTFPIDTNMQDSIVNLLNNNKLLA